MRRSDGRTESQLRPIRITRHYLKHAEGSALIEIGDTKVICSVSVEEKVPPHLMNSNTGWITAEYAMIPRSTGTRIIRESSKGKIGGRTHEIQRLIGRSLRAVMAMNKIGQRTLWVDCDVIQADGGTRTAAITGSFVAMVDAVARLQLDGKINENPIHDFVAATSVGVVRGTRLLDLAYDEDVIADVDMNIIVTGAGQFVEVQGTAEHHTFSKEEMDLLLELAKSGIQQLIQMQKEVLQINSFK